MRKRFTRFLAAVALLMFLMPFTGWGQTRDTKSYTLTISASDFNTTSYAANNNKKTTNAIASDNSTYEVSWTSNQVMKNDNNMQWQKNNGYIYNSTDLGTITSVTVNSSAGSFTTYYGTSEHPTSGTTVGNGFFTTKVGNATGTTSSVVIVFTIETGGGSTVDTPQISGNNPFLTSTEVTITCGTDGAAIQYSVDNGTNWTDYSAPFTLNATTTVKAKATKSGMTDSSEASKTFTKVNPMTVSAALTAISALPNNGTIADQCVGGIVCTAGGSVNNGAITYYISADGTTTDRLQVYKGKGLYNADFTSSGDIAIGDVVVVYGTLKNYNGNTPEFDQGSYLLSKVRQPVISTSVTELTGFTYVEGSGPSAAQTVSVSGLNLTADISLSLGENSNFEMCQTENGTYNNSLTLTQSEGTVSATNIYVRLKSGLSKAANYAGTITLISTDATDKTVSLSGSVTGQKYDVNVATELTGGSIEADPTSAEEGATVSLTANPDAAYTFGSWSVYKHGDQSTTISVTNNEFTMPAYAVDVTATFNAKPTNTVTCAITPAAGGTLESEPTSAYEGQTVTLTYTEETGYILSTVVITKTSDGTATGITPTAGAGKTFTFTMPGYAVTATANYIAGVTDVLTRTTTGIDNGGGYGDWSGKTSNSDAEYAGRSAGANNSIQLRDKNNTNTPGIVTTSTGGKVKKVSVSWNSNTTSGRYITVYGKTSAYSGYSDLYSNNSSTVGTSLGTIVCGTSTELTVTGNYDYIGIKASEPLYLDQINITWDPIKYTVTYDANGGTGSMSDPNSPYTSNQTVTVLSNSFTGPVVSEVTQEFARWNTKTDGSGTNYNPGATFSMPKENVTLYAQWIAPCTEKATMDDVVLNAAYVPGENRIKLEMLSDVAVLGGCDITDYGFVYSTSVANPTIGADNCTKIVVGNEYTSAGDDIEYTKDNATLGATYYVRSYAINNAGTAYSAVESVMIASSYPTYTITYSTNGNSDGSSTINQGNAIGTLPTPTESYIPDGYEFVGWYNGASYGNTAYPTLVTSATVPTDDMNLKAIFKISPSGGEQCIEITVDDLTGSNNYTTTHSFTKGTTTFNAYGVYKNNGIQMNSGKDTYIKNTNTLPGVITRFALTWSTGTSVNTVTMYANGGAVASTSSTKLAKLSAGTSQSINNLVGSNYNYFYLDGTTVTGACVMTSFKIFYIDYYYTTSATVPSGDYWHVNGSGVLIENSTIPAGSYTLTSPITVPSEKTLTINGYLGTAPENLIIEDGGQLITSNKVNATLKKTVDSYTVATGTNENPTDGWYFIASPVDDYATSNLALSTADLYAYDEVTNYWWNAKNEAVGNHAFTTLKRGQGYLYANSADQTLPFAGEMEASDTEISVELSYAGSGSSKGVNLLGNPFTRDLTGADIVLDGTNITSYYAVENGTEITSRAIADYPIKPGRGFIVQATDDNQTLVFNPSSKGKRNETKVKPAFIRIEAGNEDFMDCAYVQLGEGNTLRKMTINDNVAHVYVMKDGKDYAAATIAEAQGEMPVNFRAYVAGEYTITVNPEEVEMGYLHLIDNIAGKDIDLLATPSYTFNARTDDYESRFRLVFSANNENQNENEKDFAFFSNGQLIVTGEGTLHIIDMMGRVISTEVINGTSSKAINAKAGVYVLRLTNGENVKTQKIVIR